MLVVVSIIALLVGSAVLSLGLIGRGDGAARDAERLQKLLVVAREQAELENREYGVRLLADGYEFLVFDPLTRRWSRIDDRQLGRTRWSQAWSIELDVEGRRVVTARGREDQSLQADFGIDATGELTPFELRLRAPTTAIIWRVGPNNNGDPEAMALTSASAVTR